MAIHNILFFLNCTLSPQKGGIPRVTNILSKEFAKIGIKSYAIGSELPLVEDDVSYKSWAFQSNKTNDITEQIRSIVIENSIDLIIATDCSTPFSLNILTPLKGFVTIVGHYHNSPFGLLSWLHPLAQYKWAQLIIVRKISFLIQRIRLRERHAKFWSLFDKLILLSKGYETEINKLAKVKNGLIEIIENPIDYQDTNYPHNNKINEIVYVGRIDDFQKRIHSLINIWKLSAGQLPTWTLTIVGTGPDAEKYKVKSRDIDRIQWIGQADPTKYYQRAKIILLTSNFEGLPMVLLEAMKNGCVPIVYNSFAAINDIIIDNYNGIIVKPFNDRAFAKTLVMLCNNEERLSHLSHNTTTVIEKFSLETIIQKWINLFNSISK